MGSIQTYKTDWLASNPVFYNEITGKISHNINEVIDYNAIEFHPEGLNNYLDFGYSVFEQTPLKHIKFLPHSSTIKFENGKILLTQEDDITDKLIDIPSHEDDVLHIIEKRVNKWADSVKGEIILPLSGGYDSRLLAFFIKEKERLRTFSYGISENQIESFEVVKAKKVADMLKLKWQFIPLGFYHNYINEWDNLYGISTHAHGMYHLEFYNNMMPMIEGENPFLSGIVGDIWAGTWSFDNINSPEELVSLSKTHGLNADSKKSLLKSKQEYLINYFEKNKKKLNIDSYRIIESVRLKIILLSYLMKIPAHYGFKSWSPFLEPDIALAMLNLPTERRKDRIWQSDFFKKNNLDIENQKLNFAWENTLNQQAIKNIPPIPLNKKLLRELIDEDYIEQINKALSSKSLTQILILKLLTIWGSRGVLYRMGFRQNSFEKHHQEVLKAYYAYLTLKPIENLLIKRNNFAQIKK